MQTNTMDSASNYGRCSICGDTGWEIYKASTLAYGEPMELDFARKCKCTGNLRITDRTGVPEEFSDADLHKFNFSAYSVDIGKIERLAWSLVNDYNKWEAHGKGLYLWSKTPGSGKTFLACSIAKMVMIKFDKKMRFITAPDYIKLVGESYKRERYEDDSSEAYRECAVLVFDDLGAQIDKDWQRQEIFRLVNNRIGNGLITIYTSNMDIGHLNVDSRTKDRIVKSSIVIPMPEESIRQKKAKIEQERFLAEI